MPVEDQPLLISNQPPTNRQDLLAKAFLGILLACYLTTITFSDVQLPRIGIFIPILDVVLFIVDLITAVLLYSHASVLGSRPLRILANGYLFTALIILAHGLTFPGAFSPGGLFGATIETSTYLQTVWRAGLPLTVLAYAIAKGRGDMEFEGALKGLTILNAAAVVTVVAAIIWMVTSESRLLPQMMVDAQQKRWSFDLPFMIPLELCAIAVLWWRRQSILDLWLLLVLCTWLIATLLVGATSYRYSLVWYQSRIYGLLASSLVLLALLSQMGTLYARLAVSILKQRRERESRLMQVDATLAVVAHEINQPLAAIVMNGSTGLKVLGRSGQQINTLEEILEDIVRDGRRVSDIVGGIRNLFKRDDQAREHVSLEGLITDTLAFMSNDLDARHVVIETPTIGPTATVHGDRTQLQQLLLNLITNAMEAMDSVGARDRRIRVATERQGADIRVTVEDSGPGIDPKIQDAVFDPFVSTKAKGAGLGLSICRTIVEAHGGQVWVAKSRYGGAMIGFSLLALADVSSRHDFDRLRRRR